MVVALGGWGAVVWTESNNLQRGQILLGTGRGISRQDPSPGGL